MGDDYPEVLNGSLLKLTFVHSEVQFVLLQDLQNLPGNLSVFIEGSHKDEDVIQVDHNHTFCDEFLKDVVYHHLKGSWAICETERHNEWFEQATVCLESSLLLVAFLGADIVKGL